MTHLDDKLDEVKNDIKTGVGEATGNEQMEAEGRVGKKADEAKEGVENAVEDAKEGVAEKVNDVLDGDKHS